SISRRGDLQRATEALHAPARVASAPVNTYILARTADCDDLSSGDLHSPTGAAGERPAIRGGSLFWADYFILSSGAHFPCNLAGAIPSRRHFRVHKARAASPSRDRRGDRTPRAAARMGALTGPARRPRSRRLCTGGDRLCPRGPACPLEGLFRLRGQNRPAMPSSRLVRPAIFAHPTAQAT